jgi:hypothetical protein
MTSVAAARQPFAPQPGNNTRPSSLAQAPKAKPRDERDRALSTEEREMLAIAEARRKLHQHVMAKTVGMPKFIRRPATSGDESQLKSHCICTTHESRSAVGSKPTENVVLARQRQFRQIVRWRQLEQSCFGVRTTKLIVSLLCHCTVLVGSLSEDENRGHTRRIRRRRRSRRVESAADETNRCQCVMKEESDASGKHCAVAVADGVDSPRFDVVRHEERVDHSRNIGNIVANIGDMNVQLGLPARIGDGVGRNVPAVGS